MRNLDVSTITDAAQLRLKAGSLQFLQDENKEIFIAIIRSLIGDNYSTSTAYVIYGCIPSVYMVHSIQISAGAIFYNSDIYLVDSYTYDPLFGPTLMFSLVTTQDVQDPVTFTDASTHYIHNITKAVLTNSTGAHAYNPVFLAYNPNNISTVKISIGDWDMLSTPSIGVDTSFTFDQIVDIKIIIYNDLGTQIYPLSVAGSWSYGTVGGYPTFISLTRLSGTFDSSGFDSTGYNRGFIIIQHT